MIYENGKTNCAFKIYNEDQFDTIVNGFESPHRIAHEPKRYTEGENKGKIELEEFPLYVQLVWLPRCGFFPRCFDKKTIHLNFLDFKNL